MEIQLKEVQWILKIYLLIIFHVRNPLTYRLIIKLILLKAQHNLIQTMIYLYRFQELQDT